MELVRGKKKTMKKETERILFTGTCLALGTSVILGLTVGLVGAAENRNTDQVIAEVDAFLADVKERTAPKEAPKYTWEEQLIAKITGFEVGNTGEDGKGCPTCLHYVASACVNRMVHWYGGDPVAMVTDKNDEAYMMNPEYADTECIEMNGWNYYVHADEMLKVVREAEERTADIWYWDCEDTQRDWAELVYYCPTDHMYFYR